MSKKKTTKKEEKKIEEVKEEKKVEVKKEEKKEKTKKSKKHEAIGKTFNGKVIFNAKDKLINGVMRVEIDFNGEKTLVLPSEIK